MRLPSHSTWLVAAAALALLCVGSGCGDDTVESDVGIADAADDLESGPTPYHVEAAFRFTGMDITRPSSIGPILEPAINEDIQNQVLNVLVHARNFSATSGTATLDIVGAAGTPTDNPGEFRWADGVVPDYSLAQIHQDGAFETLEDIELVFPATFPGSDPPQTIEIQLRSMEATGSVSQADDGSLRINVFLDGAILQEDADEIMVPLVTPPRTLTDLLDVRNKDWPLDAEVKTGWRLAASVAGVEVQLAAP